MKHVLAIAWVLVAHGCDDPEPLPPPLPPSAEPPPPSSTVTAEPRERTYFLANDDMICVVYWEEGLRSSVKKTVPCPREIAAGERARLMGRTCMREAPKPDRNVPVRCPKQLFYVERDDARGKGEFKLRQEK